MEKRVNFVSEREFLEFLNNKYKRVIEEVKSIPDVEQYESLLKVEFNKFPSDLKDFIKNFRLDRYFLEHFFSTFKEKKYLISDKEVKEKIEDLLNVLKSFYAVVAEETYVVFFQKPYSVPWIMPSFIIKGGGKVIVNKNIFALEENMVYKYLKSIGIKPELIEKELMKYKIAIKLRPEKQYEFGITPHLYVYDWVQGFSNESDFLKFLSRLNSNSLYDLNVRKEVLRYSRHFYKITLKELKEVGVSEEEVDNYFKDGTVAGMELALQKGEDKVILPNINPVKHKMVMENLERISEVDFDFLSEYLKNGTPLEKAVSFILMSRNAVLKNKLYSTIVGQVWDISREFNTFPEKVQEMFKKELVEMLKSSNTYVDKLFKFKRRREAVLKILTTGKPVELPNSLLEYLIVKYNITNSSYFEKLCSPKKQSTIVAHLAEKNFKESAKKVLKYSIKKRKLIL